MSRSSAEWVPGSADAWGWHDREELARALAWEATDWFKDLPILDEDWCLSFRWALGRGASGPCPAFEERIAWSTTVLPPPVGHGDACGRLHTSAIELLAAAWLLGRWDWVVGASSVVLDGALVETPERGQPGERCSCGGMLWADEGEGCEHLLLAAVLKGALRHRPARAVRP